MIYTRALSHITILVALLGVALLGHSADHWQLAVTAEDIDFDACTTVRDGKPLPTSKDEVLAALGLSQGPIEGWSAGERSREKERIDIVYTLVFKKPVALGALMVREVKKVEAQTTEDGDWQELELNVNTPGRGTRAFATLPVGYTATALRFTQPYRGYDPLGMSMIRLYKARLTNITRSATGNAKSFYTQKHMFSPPTHYTAQKVVEGTGSWKNVGLETGEDKISSPPITDVQPTWMMLSWEDEQPIVGLHMDSNVKALEIYQYIGPAGINPVVATADEWRKIRGWSEEGAIAGKAPTYHPRDGSTFWHKEPFERTVYFKEPVTTRGLKFVIEGTEAHHYNDTNQVAHIRTLHTFIDLGDRDIPMFATESDISPFDIGYELEDPGTVTMVVDSPDGSRVRNLIARRWKEDGAHKTGWDLRDENGETVQPGTYRWQAVTGPIPQLKYQLSAYPNVRNFHPENTPWRNGTSGSGGWLADHTSPNSVAAVGDSVYLGAAVTESGETFIEVTTDGKRLWGNNNFGSFTGPSMLAANDTSVFVGTPLRRVPYTSQYREAIYRVDREARKYDTFNNLMSSQKRERGMVGIAANNEHVFVAVRATSNWLSNAMSGDDVDIVNCLPLYPEQRESNKQFNPNPRHEFVRLLRLIGTPPGQRGSLNQLESTDMPAPSQHIVVSFKRPVPIGSLVFPFPYGDYTVKFSVLKKDSPYPGDAEKDSQWQTFFSQDSPGRSKEARANTKRHDKAGPSQAWTVVPAPPLTFTRALRITFDKSVDELDDVLGGLGGEIGGKTPTWKAHFDGMKILQRRFKNLFPTATIQVNSGTVSDPITGEWDAERTEPLTEANPAIYALQWNTAQEMRGLAIKEIDGNDTRIDIFVGDGPIDINGEISEDGERGWREIASYEQQRRYYYQPDPNRNLEAHYMDGYVDFGETVKTRAMRLRIVSQWTTKAEGRAGSYGVHQDRGGMDMDPTRCRVYGVAPLMSIGGDAPIDPLATERIEVLDATTAKIVNEVFLKQAGHLTLAPNNDLLAISGNTVVRVDLSSKTGDHPVVISDTISPDGITCDRHGNIYVYDGGDDRRNIRVYSPTGEYLRSIGKPGGHLAGPWDPERFSISASTRVHLDIDSKDQLWVVEKHDTPKRHSVWTLDGKHIRDHLGNTRYGGGGVLNPWNKKQLFYAADMGTLEFEIDWETGLTTLKAVPWRGKDGGEVPFLIDDRLYLCTRPRFGFNGVGIVYLYDPDTMTMRRVAAMGRAGNHPPLRTPEIEGSLGTKALAEMNFVWSDTNGDGQPQVDEITFTPNHDSHGVSWFDNQLGIQSGQYRHDVTSYLPNGTPVYTTRRMANISKNAPGRKLDNGQIVTFDSGQERHDSAQRAYTSEGDGTPTWSYPTEGYGVHALTTATPLTPEQVVSEFAIIGSAHIHEGDLGEVFVTNTNIGRWHLWTADGLLAAEVLRDRRDPNMVPWSMTEYHRGMDLTGLTPGPEHFSGSFGKIHEDNTYNLVVGHNHISVVQILGLEKFKRLSGEITVTAKDIRRVQEWEEKRQVAAVYQRAPVYHSYPASGIVVNGDLSDWDDVPELQITPDNFRTTFKMAHSPNTLYLAYRVYGYGPFKNQGNDWRRKFKTGAVVDLQMSTNPNVNRKLEDLAEGDFRLIMTPQDGKPMAVIYQPVAPSADKSEAWETHTMVWRTAFNRVAKLPDVTIRTSTEHGSYMVEVAIPLKEIGLEQITDGLRLNFDWGVIATNDNGTDVLGRHYWANQNTAILADEAAEAQINPNLWGHVIFHTSRVSALPGLSTPGLLPGASDQKEMTEDEVLDLLED